MPAAPVNAHEFDFIVLGGMSLVTKSPIRTSNKSD